MPSDPNMGCNITAETYQDIETLKGTIRKNLDKQVRSYLPDIPFAGMEVFTEAELVSDGDPQVVYYIIGFQQFLNAFLVFIYGQSFFFPTFIFCPNDRKLSRDIQRKFRCSGNFLCRSQSACRIVIHFQNIFQIINDLFVLCSEMYYFIRPEIFIQSKSLSIGYNRYIFVYPRHNNSAVSCVSIHYVQLIRNIADKAFSFR